jgi:Na+/melibiose symporter-like transporter
MVKQIYDAFTDPFVGKLSDRSWTRWGRRKPWIVAGTIPSGVLWVMMWLSPSWLGTSSWAQILYYTLVLLAFNTLNTVVSVPYNAMVPDITVDYDDRTTVVLAQNVFGMLASAIFSSLQGVIIELFPDPDNPGRIDYQKGYAVAALVSLPAVVIPPLLSIMFVTERKPESFDEDDPSPYSSGKPLVVRWLLDFVWAIWQALLFKEFMMVTMVMCFGMVAAYFFINNIVLYAKYVLENEGQTFYMILTGQVCERITHSQQRERERECVCVCVCVWSLTCVLYSLLLLYRFSFGRF